MIRALTIAAVLLPLTLTACSIDSEAVDGSSDSFLLLGKTDGAGIREGSPEALAVLQLVNESSLAVLDDDVALDARAARNIVELREASGAINTLAELDAVAYVGPFALERLLDYAYDNGYLDDLRPAGDEPVLRLVNSASFEVLDDSAEVGLDIRAATGIVAHRDGADGIAGTGDDDLFDSIEELDAVSYVGTRALSALRSYAASHDQYARAPWKQGWPVDQSNRYLASFEGNLLPYSNNRQHWDCHLLISESQIFCATYSPETFGTVTTIDEDGRFSSGTDSRAHLRGRVYPNGQVTIDSVRTVDSNREQDKRLSPMDSHLVEPLCWKPRVNFPSGGWIGGHWIHCDQQ